MPMLPPLTLDECRDWEKALEMLLLAEGRSECHGAPLRRMPGAYFIVCSKCCNMCGMRVPEDPEIRAKYDAISQRVAEAGRRAGAAADRMLYGIMGGSSDR